MSPGYDRAAHLDFRRVIDAGCMSCHNGYPRGVVKDDGAGPRFGDTLPEGIDCQRCHGPGQAHVDAVRSGDKKAIVQTIVNPAKLDRDRQLEACMQCHLETTSSPLPFRIQRYEQPLFSSTPGKPLSDYFIYFDRAPGAAGRDDTFEIAGGAYRLRQSACFQRSAMTCLTCHNPHETGSGPSAIAREIAVCRGCHQGAHRGGTPQVAGVRAGATCVDCHMPKRRTQDAVHVVMTDHYIQRRPVRPDLLAARAESDSLGQGDYRVSAEVAYTGSRGKHLPNTLNLKSTGARVHRPRGPGSDGVQPHVTTLQAGFPLGFTATPNLIGSGYGLRPNVDPNCDKKVDGSATDRLNMWFNTACLRVPTPDLSPQIQRRIPVYGGSSAMRRARTPTCAGTASTTGISPSPNARASVAASISRCAPRRSISSTACSSGRRTPR